MTDSAARCLEEAKESLDGGEHVVVVIVRENDPMFGDPMLDGPYYDVRWSDNIKRIELLGSAAAIEEANDTAESGL